MDPQYAKDYSDEGFWEKIGKFAKNIGRETLEKALTLYYCGIDPATPPASKAIIVGALGYLIFPLDGIPDFTPLVGYADDAGALAMAMGLVYTSISEKHIELAKAKVVEWFGS